MAMRQPLWFRLQRHLRHRWLEDQVLRSVGPQALLRLTEAVAHAEKRHSGQIRVCIEGGLPPSYLWRDATPRERAVALFGKLRIWDTEHNNGVLIYLLLADKAIEVVADRGIARIVADAAWAELVRSMQTALQAGHYEDALAGSIDQVSALLEEHFSASTDARNELPDAPFVGPFCY